MWMTVFLWKHISDASLDFFFIIDTICFCVFSKLAIHDKWFFMSLSGCLTGIIQQGGQVPRTHNNPTSPTMDTAKLPVLGHPAAFTPHQLCLWSGCQWLSPSHHWLHHFPHHRWVTSAPLTLKWKHILCLPGIDQETGSRSLHLVEKTFNSKLLNLLQAHCYWTFEMLSSFTSFFFFICSLLSLHSHSPPHWGHWGEENWLQLWQPGGQETKLECVTPPLPCTAISVWSPCGVSPLPNSILLLLLSQLVGRGGDPAVKT